MESSHEQSVEAVDLKSSINGIAQDSIGKDGVILFAPRSLRVHFCTFIKADYLTAGTSQLQVPFFTGHDVFSVRAREYFKVLI